MSKLPLIALMIAALVLISPVSAALVVTGANIDYPAQTIDSGTTNIYSYTTIPDESISLLEFQVPLGSSTNFTLYYGDGYSVDGWIVYSSVGLFRSYSEVALGGNVYSETFTDTYVSTAIGKKVQFSSYAKNTTSDPVQTGFAVYAQGYGLYSDEIAFYPVNNLPKNMISQVDYHSDQGVILKTYTEKSDTLANHISSSVGENVNQGSNNALTMILENIGSFLSVIMTCIYWAKYILIDNIVPIFALYLIGGLTAYTAKQATRRHPDFFQIITDFVSLQVGFYKSLIWIWQKIIFMLTSLVQALLKWL